MLFLFQHTNLLVVPVHPVCNKHFVSLTRKVVHFEVSRSIVSVLIALIFTDFRSLVVFLKFLFRVSLISFVFSSGILIGKKHLFHNKIPCVCGGGTVNFVTRTNVEYIDDIEIREEGGTPDIIGSIRAGLVFQLKDAVGHQIIEKREDELVNKFFERLSKIDSLIILGSQTVSRLAIFSFLIYVPMIKKYLHYNFICSLLNDLFGIQVRSGCACAGPYVLVKEKLTKYLSKFSFLSYLGFIWYQ